MGDFFAMFHSIWTVVLVVIFIGIVAWAWSGKRKKSFDAAARLPLEDDDNNDAARQGGQR
jgi:cytochrome c oxidase cbb3-type subunit 4